MKSQRVACGEKTKERFDKAQLKLSVEKASKQDQDQVLVALLDLYEKGVNA